MSHTIPSEAELEANIEKAKKDLEEMEKKDQKDVNEIIEDGKKEDNNDVDENRESNTDDNSNNEDDKESDDVSPDIEEDKEEKKELPTQEELEKKQKEEEEVDYKKRHADSTREAQRLYEENKAYRESRKVPMPTDEEMEKLFPEWADYSDLEKRLLKKDELRDRQDKIMLSVAEKADKFEEWRKKVNDFSEDPQTLINHPRLEGKVDDFKIFATKNKRVGSDLSDLVSAFLYNQRLTQVKNKGKMFEVGTGGAKEKENKNDGKVSIEQASKLRKTNYKEYVKLVKSGKIDSSL